MEGYNASNSDNNFDNINFNTNKKNRSGVSIRKGSDVTPIEVSSCARKLSKSNSEHQFEDIQEKANESSNNTNKQKIISDDDKDLWEHLESVGIKGNKVLEQQIDSDTPTDKKKAMTIAEFLGQDASGAKTSSYNRIELHGNKDERVSQINDHG